MPRPTLTLAAVPPAPGPGASTARLPNRRNPAQAFNVSAAGPVSPSAQPETLPAMSFPVDRHTFDRLMLGHLLPAQRFAVRLTGDADAAEEVVQEALVRAARGWATFRGRSTF